MAKVTEKNTKKEILEALKEAETLLAERRAANTTSADVARVKEVEAKKADAKEVINMGILNETVTNKYNNLLETIDMFERQIEEMHSIKTGIDTYEALLILQNNKKADFEAEMTEKEADFNSRMKARKEETELEIAELKAHYSKLSSELKETYNQAKKELERDRKREAEEFSYNLKREREIENNKWADEKAVRERELTSREESITSREILAEEKDNKIIVLTATIEEMETSNKEAVANAFKDGEAKAEKTCAIKIAAANKDAEWRIKVAESEVASLKASNADKDAKLSEMAAKLDDAYTRIQEMAIQQAKASTPRVLETTSK